MVFIAIVVIAYREMSDIALCHTFVMCFLFWLDFTYDVVFCCGPNFIFCAVVWGQAEQYPQNVLWVCSLSSLENMVVVTQTQVKEKGVSIILQSNPTLHSGGLLARIILRRNHNCQAQLQLSWMLS